MTDLEGRLARAAGVGPVRSIAQDRPAPAGAALTP